MAASDVTGEPDDGKPTPPGDRTVLDQVSEVFKRSGALRVEVAQTYANSRKIRDEYATLRHELHGDRTFRLAALNLMEDATLARVREQDAARQRASAERAVRQSAERYRLLFESMTEGFAVVEAVRDERRRRLDYAFVECNPAFAAQIGAADTLGSTLRSVLPSGADEWFEAFDRIVETGEPASFETSLYGERWLSISASQIGGVAARLAVVVTDITRRKRAEDALRASELRLRLIVENAREYAIVSMELDRTIRSWSAGAQAITGYVEGEVLGLSADLIFTDEDRAVGVPQREARTAVESDRASDERWHLRKDRSRFWGSGVMTVMRDDAGDAVGLVKIFRDQTAELLAKEALERSRHRLQEALEETERARAEAEAATQAKDRFLAMLSHELRTPLTPILLAADLIEMRDDLPPDMRDAVAMIRRNVGLEARFVDDLLDVTRITRGTLEFHRAPMDAHEAIEGAVEISRPDFDAKGQRLDVRLAATRSVVEGDAPRLQQATWNLLKNASKFTPPGGSIEVRSANDGDALVIVVRDTGIGIPPGQLSTIFGEFVQADPGISREYGGLGLGLAIARATVVGHGGALSAHSDGPGRGATFTMSLPLATEPSAGP